MHTLYSLFYIVHFFRVRVRTRHGEENLSETRGCSAKREQACERGPRLRLSPHPLPFTLHRFVTDMGLTFSSIYETLSGLTRWTKEKDVRILMLGLDSAGKVRIAYQLFAEFKGGG